MRFVPRDPNGRLVAPGAAIVVAVATASIGVLTVLAVVQGEWAKVVLGVLALAGAAASLVWMSGVMQSRA